MTEKPTVFIHTNDKQIVGACVGTFSMKHASKNPAAFDVKLIRLEDTPHLNKRQGQQYLRKGKKAVWLNEDLQSFSPLRRMVPQLMGFKGRALVTDPDVFAIGDVLDLLNADMNGKSILCRHIRDGYKGNGHTFYASSVMLLDCARLKHWRWNEEVDQMFEGKLDYGPWIGLKNEDPDSIGEIGEEWNSFDHLAPETRLLHTTERLTQPWKTGLPIDFDLTTKSAGSGNGKPASGGSLLARALRRLDVRQQAASSESEEVERYQEHPDPAQERLFFQLLEGALHEGYLDEELLRQRIRSKDVRPDAFERLAALAGTVHGSTT